MSRWVDGGRFPRTAAYLGALGDDLNALPECEARFEMYEDFVRLFPHVFEGVGIEPELTARIRGLEGLWVPEVMGVAALTMVRDVAFDSDQAFAAWNREHLQKMYRKPFFRALLYVLSPKIVFAGAAARWEKTHRGSRLTATGSSEDANAILEFPEGLFSETFTRSLEQAFSLALEAAGAKEVDLRLAELSPTRVRFAGHWR
jgi:hypothetical protein